jgi:hypothetical protein
MASTPAELTTLLSRLASARVEFVLVGGLAAVAQGAPITTHDVDIVHQRTPENVERLVTLLGSIDARYRARGSDQVLRPAASALLGPGHSLLMTKLGPLDVLGAIEGGRTYEDLLPHSTQIAVGGNPVAVLGLTMLADLKRGSTHPKDRNTLLILEETLRQLGG